MLPGGVERCCYSLTQPSHVCSEADICQAASSCNFAFICFLHGPGWLTSETLDFPEAAGWRRQEEVERTWKEGAVRKGETNLFRGWKKRLCFCKESELFLPAVLGITFHSVMPQWSPLFHQSLPSTPFPCIFHGIVSIKARP